MGNIPGRKSKIYKKFEEIVHKDAPVLKLESNKLYKDRISKISSDPLSLDLEISQFLDSYSTNCSSSKNSFGSTIQGLEEDLKQNLQNNKMTELQFKNKCVQEQVMCQQTNKFAINRHRSAYYKCIGIDCQSDQQQKENEDVKNQDSESLIQDSIKNLIASQKRSIYDATAYLVRCGALKKI